MESFSNDNKIKSENKSEKEKFFVRPSMRKWILLQALRKHNKELKSEILRNSELGDKQHTK